MTRSFYFLGGLVAMALILLVPVLDTAPARQAAPPSAEALAAATPASAIDDLAAWPAAAGR